MSLIKLAIEQRKQNFAQRHPIITGGIALTGGLAAADAGLNMYKYNKQFKTLKGVMPQVKKGLKEGALYGGILSTVEPAISHGVLKQKEPTE